MVEELVLVERPRPGVVVLRLNRAEKRNALNVPLLEAIVTRFHEFEEDAANRVVVLAAAGSIFCAGLDLKEVQDAALAERSAELIADALRALSGSRMVTIAAVQGSAIAGGAGLMSACDFVVASESAQFGYPEVHRGLVPGLVMTFLRRQLRERDIRELILIGQNISASRAMEIGLVNRVVAVEQVLPTVLELAEKVLLGAPNAIAATKQLLADLWSRTVDEDLLHAHGRHMTARNSGEAAEGAKAFLEKRPPRWQDSQK